MKTHTNRTRRPWILAQATLAGAITIAGVTALAVDEPQKPVTITLDWYTIDSGGGAVMMSGAKSNGTLIEIVGSVGQPDAGTFMTGFEPMAMKTFDLETGFRAAPDGQSTWSSPGTNDSFFDAENWEDGGVPEATDTVVFDEGPMPTPNVVNFSSMDATTDRLLILEDIIELRFFDQDYHLCGSKEFLPALVVGGLDNVSSSLRISSPGSTGQRGIYAPWVSIADGLNSFAELLLADANALLETSTRMTIGRRGSASVTVSNGAALRNEIEVVVGDEAGSDGTVNVDGAGSQWLITNASAIEFGRYGDAHIVISGGAELRTTTDSINGDLVLAREAGSSADVLITGAGSQWIEEGTAPLFLGNRDRARLRPESGGFVSIPGGIRILPNGTLAGDGTVRVIPLGQQARDVENFGVVQPGPTATEGPGVGTLTIEGNYIQRDLGNLGSLEVRVQDVAGDLQHDALIVTGNATLGGGIVVTELTPINPGLGETIPVISAASVAQSFDVALMPGLPGPQFLNLNYGLGPAGGVGLVVSPLFPPDGFDPLTGDAESGQPVDVAVGDLDNDGDDDLAVVLADDNDQDLDGKLLVLLSDTLPDGTWIGFSSATLQDTGEDPRAVVIGQLDADGFADIAVANRFDNDVRVYINNGEPMGLGFSAQPDLPVGNGPRSLAVGKFTPGAAQDLAVLNENDLEIAIFENNGSAVFVDSGIQFATGGGGGLIRPQDLDDNKTDDVIHIDPMGFAELFPQTTEGVFGPATVIPFGSASTPTTPNDRVAVGFLRTENPDDPIDITVHLVVSREHDDTVSIIINEGSFGFAPAVDIPIGTQPLDVTVLDLEGDGDKDVAVLLGNDTGPAEVQLLRNDQNGTNVILAVGDIEIVDPNTTFVRTGDLDGNASDDLVTLADDLGGAPIPPPESNGPVAPPIGVLINATPGTCPTDITGPVPGEADGNVDALDFLLLISQWGSPCIGSCETDITGPTPLVPDGNVDSLDFLLLISQWGSPGNCKSP